VVTPATGVDSIIECDLAEQLDFTDPEMLSAAIEKKTGEFIDDIERFLSDHEARSGGRR
jgi:hypothetical protein